jgi:hypothetical protein
MSAKALRTYLNDHLAGATAAIELLDHLIKLHGEDERRQFYQELRTEVAEDRQVLQNILEQVGGRESLVRQAAAWVSEKLGEAKLLLDDPGDDQLRVLEALETLALGIQGKLSLWRALGAVQGAVPSLPAIDFSRLEQRAEAQFQRVDHERLRIAQTALSG